MQSQYFIVYRFVSEQKRKVVIEQTQFLSTVILCNEFKLENIYYGVHFCRSLEKLQKLEPAKILCHMVTHLIQTTH